MANSYKKAIAYTLMTAGPALGASNIISVVYKTFFASATLTEVPAMYQTSTGNFIIGVTAMSLALTGRTLLSGKLDVVQRATKQIASFRIAA